jgi:DNA-binding NarL/FixJ family response regulator
MRPRPPATGRASTHRAVAFEETTTVGVGDVDPRLLEHLARGRSRKQIAESLGVSTYTVARRIDRLNQHFDARTNIHLVVKAVRQGVI